MYMYTFLNLEKDKLKNNSINKSIHTSCTLANTISHSMYLNSLSKPTADESPNTGKGNIKLINESLNLQIKD